VGGHGEVDGRAGGGAGGRAGGGAGGRGRRVGGGAVGNSPDRRVSCGAPHRHGQPGRRGEGHDEVGDEQRSQGIGVAQGRAQRKGQSRAGEDARRAERDALRERVGDGGRGDLRDRVEDQWLGDRDQDLPRQRGGEGVRAEPDGAAERGQPRTRQKRAAEAAIQRQARRDREDHVEQREDLGEPADGALGDVEVPGRVRGDRGVRQPQELVGGRNRGVGGDGSPARSHAAARYDDR
jgi:hypothetical protein